MGRRMFMRVWARLGIICLAVVDVGLGGCAGAGLDLGIPLMSLLI